MRVAATGAEGCAVVGQPPFDDRTKLGAVSHGGAKVLQGLRRSLVQMHGGEGHPGVIVDGE
jgi:hypothetical protein